MTDEEIKRAKAHFKYGIQCDIFSEPVLSYAKTVLWAFEEINRQKAEIEMLKEEVGKEFTCFVGDPHKVEYCPYLEELEAAKAEAIKEFAEDYKDQIKNYTGMFTDDGFYVSFEAIMSAVDFVLNKKLDDMVGDNDEMSI
jgi:hypothetical protein